MDSGRRFLLFFLISKMNGFLYLCLLHFKKKMEQEDFNIREHQLTSRERDFENALRPLSFEDFSGQDKVVENLRIFVKAARLRGEALDHVLLHGQLLTQPNPICALSMHKLVRLAFFTSGE